MSDPPLRPAAVPWWLRNRWGYCPLSAILSNLPRTRFVEAIAGRKPMYDPGFQAAAVLFLVITRARCRGYGNLATRL